MFAVVFAAVGVLVQCLRRVACVVVCVLLVGGWDVAGVYGMLLVVDSVFVGPSMYFLVICWCVDCVCAVCWCLLVFADVCFDGVFAGVLVCCWCVCWYLLVFAGVFVGAAW